MNNAIQTLYTKLKAGIPSVSGRIARGMARQGEQLPLIEFHVAGGENASHSGDRTIQVDFNIDALNLESAADIAEELKSTIEAIASATPEEGDLVSFTDYDQSGDPDESVFPSNSPLNQSAQTYARHSISYSISYIPV